MRVGLAPAFPKHAAYLYIMKNRMYQPPRKLHGNKSQQAPSFQPASQLPFAKSRVERLKAKVEPLLT